MISYFPRLKTNNSLILVLILLAGITSCGGGNDPDDPPTNSAPVTTDSSVATNEDTVIAVLLNVTDDEDATDSLVFTISAPSNGVLSGTAPNLTYTPNANFSGSDSFDFSATDSGGEISNVSTVSITVNPVNDAPVITQTGPLMVAMDEDSTPTDFVAPTITASDIDSGTLAWSGSIASNGTATVSGTGASPTITYVPDVNFNGSDSFNVTVSDGSGGSDVITVDVTVEAQNDLPTISGSPSTTANDGVWYTFTPNANDIDGDSLSFNIQNMPAWAMFDTVDGTLSGTPELSDVGVDFSNIIISVTAGGDTVDMAAFSISVSAFDITQQWEQVVFNGFGDVNNGKLFPNIVFGEYLYAGVENETTGVELWRSIDGIDWNQAVTGIFLVGAIFDGYMYSGVGKELWRSSDGINWDQVNTDGFGDSNNEHSFHAVVFDGYLYVGTQNAITGGEIWRSIDGTTWSQVNTDGFGDSNNESTSPTVVFNGYLYAGTVNEITGGEIWRSSNGTTWTQVNTDGFGNVNNFEVSPAVVFDNYLYSDITNRATGGEIWRSSDGTTWEQAVANGLGDIENGDITFGVVLDGYLYAGTENEVTGGEIWRSSDGTTWNQVNTDGFGDSNSEGISGMAFFDDYLYVGTENVVTGGEIWRAKKEAIADTCDFSGWEKDLHNPIFESSGPGEWDDPYWGLGVVLKDLDEPVNKYKRWYIGGVTAGGDDGKSIGYATSSDGINWVPYSNNPVMTHGNTWDIDGFRGLSVIKDGSTYQMWYGGNDIYDTDRIGYATSSDGINWILYQNNPVFSPGANGSWDDEDIAHPWVIKEDLIYKMWYRGDDDMTNTAQIGLATSTDGINWQRSTSNPILSPDPAISWVDGGVDGPSVVKYGSGYTMVFGGTDQSGTNRIGYATSSDGVTWNKDDNNPILDIGTGSDWDSTAVFPEALIDDSSSLKLWYVGADSSFTIKSGLAVMCK